MERNILGYLGAAVLLLASGTEGFGDTITISLTPSSQTALLGSMVNMTLEIGGLGDHTAPSLGVFDLNLDFNPSILSFDNAVFGDPILSDQLDPTGGGNTITFASASSGSVELFDLSLDSANDLNNLQEPTFVLASLTFDAVDVGTSQLVLTINTLGDADGNPLSADVENANIDVNASPVPEPFASGLIPAAMTLVAVRLRRGNRLKNSRRRLLNER